MRWILLFPRITSNHTHLPSIAILNQLVYRFPVRHLTTTTANSTTAHSARPVSSPAMETSIPFTIPLPTGIPPSHRPHTEQKTTILVPEANIAFLNPVQEYNRDLSVACIRAWNGLRKEEGEAKWKLKHEKRGQGKGKGKNRRNKGNRKVQEDESEVQGMGEDVKVGTSVETEIILAEEKVDGGETVKENEMPEAGPSQPKYRAPRITILEALSATGLRSIRYAKEIPDVKVVLANDISPSACEAMRTNVALNGVGEKKPQVAELQAQAQAAVQPTSEENGFVEGEENALNSDNIDVGRREGCNGVVRVNEGDACALMYSHRAPHKHVDVVDLDPYGTAAPFIDAAVSSVADGGLLCVTCTDLAVLAGSNYPEKCYSNYGGVCVNAEYSHEVALRLVLHSIATAAARYGRYITPLLSLSIDFYVRVFVRVDTKPSEVKRLASKTGIVYACTFCQTPIVQPLGRTVEKEGNGQPVNLQFRMASGPTASQKCEECGSNQQVAGPMWIGPIHDPTFVKRVLNEIDGTKECYKTWPRIHGMLTVAHEELPNPFYFTSNKIHSFAHAASMPVKQVVSALLNAGYKVSRSHAASGSIKTDAPRSFIYDIVREGIKTKPVRLDKIPERSPARQFIAKPMTHTIDFTSHPDVNKFDRVEKAVYYQVNPLPNWGPGTRAKSIKVGGVEVSEIAKVENEQVDGLKRKLEVGGEGVDSIGDENVGMIEDEKIVADETLAKKVKLDGENDEMKSVMNVL